VAQEVVVKEQLTWWMISAGLTLTDRLRQTDLELVCSLWLYSSDPNNWKLVLASPRVELDGPLKAYEIVQQILSKNWPPSEPLELDMISMVRQDTPFVKSIRSLGHFEVESVPAGPTPHLPVLKRIHMSNIEDVFIEDAFVYFID
jgi:hypothetical protein